MKRNTIKYIVLVLLLAFVSRNETFAQEVSRSTAKRVAETFLNQNARRGQAPIQLQDITSETEFENFYIFSADSGFVLVAADERVIPILGYSKTGPFVTEDMPENLKWWLEGYEEQIQYVKEHRLQASTKSEQQWERLLDEDYAPMRFGTQVGPLTSTKWGQNEPGPFNLQCPFSESDNERCVVGCAPTDMAQLMRYWRHPDYGTGSSVCDPSNPYHPEFYPRTVDHGYNNWDLMPPNYTDYDTDEERLAVSTFMYHCAIALNANFNVAVNGGTSASTANIENALREHFYYKPSLDYKSRQYYSDDEWKQMFVNELSANPARPVCYRGESSSGGKHSLLCDGYSEMDDCTFFSFNWGWHGTHNNDFYCIDALHEHEPHLSYINNQGAVFGIEPDEGTITATAYPEGSGMVLGSGTHRKGTLCSITASPNENYVFSNWTKNGEVVSTEPEFGFVFTEDVAFVANFICLQHTINIESMPTNGGTVEGGGTYLEGDQCTITATPNPGYIFKGWYFPVGLSPVIPLPTFTFTVTSNLHLIAKFQPVTPTTDVYQYYCWFDQDYSTVQTGSFQTTETFFSLDASALSEGLHTLHVMLDDNGLSAPKTFLFMKTPVTSPNSTYQYHCWFDQDYGTVQTGTFGGEGFSFALDANALEEGIHTVHVMLEGDDLSASKTYMFLKAPVASSTATYTYHCWFDQDYGTVQTGTFGGDGYCFAIDASALDNGLHFLNVMLEGDDLSASKRYLFNKVPIGGEGITRWEYCLNGDWSDATVTDLVPTVSTLDIIAMLPVDPQPIRSQSFEFQINNGQPEVYAKNFITFRFWDAENRFIDRSAEYVDETVHENVVAEWIERNTTRTIVTPGPNQIHWFKLDASLGNLLEFMADHECTIQLFSPSGELVFSSMSVASIVFNGSYAREEGVFYLAVHDVEEGYDNISITYRYTGTTTQTQNVALAQGTNWFSTYVEITLDNLKAALEATGNTSITIQSKNDGLTTYNGTRWRGTLNVLDVTQMYMVTVESDCEIVLEGMPVNPSEHPITIHNGANWIAFPLSESMTLTDAFAEIAVSGDVVNSKNSGLATYTNRWRGTLGTLVPGQGCIYNSASEGDRILIFPTNAK